MNKLKKIPGTVKNVVKLTINIKYIIFYSILFSSCSLKPLHKTGNYYVKNVADSTYQFYFIRGSYAIRDSILPGKNAKIKLTGTRDLSKVNVFIIQNK